MPPCIKSFCVNYTSSCNIVQYFNTFHVVIACICYGNCVIIILLEHVWCLNVFYCDVFENAYSYCQ
jgi:predicted transglutaminase-like protease